MKTLLKNFLLPCCLLLAEQAARAQLFSSYNFRFKTYTTSDGLAHNSVKKCVSDSRGFLWIATENGLSRFDGFQFKNYRHIAGDTTTLPTNDLSDVAVDNQDRVYAAYSTGVAVLNPATGRFTQIKYNNRPLPSKAMAWVAATNTLYIFSDSGLLAYHPHLATVTETNLKIKNALNLWQLYADDNYLWALVDRAGYYRYDMARDTAYYFAGNTWPTAMYHAPKGGYYFSTWGFGFQSFDSIAAENNKEIHQLKLTGLPSYNFVFGGIAEAPRLTGTDLLWVTTQTNGLGLFSKSQKRFVHHVDYQPQQKMGLSSLYYWNLYTAPDGNLWICGWHGLTKVNPQSQYFQNAVLPELNSGLYNGITGIIDDPHNSNTAWMAVNGNGLARLSKAENKIAERYFYNEADVTKHYVERWPVYFFKDSNQVIWAGTYGGFIKIERGKVGFVPITDSGRYCYALSHYQDTRGSIWQLGSFVFEYNPYTGKNRPWHVSAAAGMPLSYYGICDATGGMMYLATSRGVFCLNTATRQIKRLNISYTFADTAGWEKVQSIAMADSVLYLGTPRGVAACNLRTLQAHKIAPESRLHHITFNAFYKDRYGNLWIYCSSGLFRYNTHTAQLSQFTTADGVYAHSNDPSYFFEYNGAVYLGNRGSYTRFYPASVNANQRAPIPYITEVSVNNRPVAPTEHGSALQLSYQSGNIGFDFTAIEYNFPEKLSFSYKLEGFDEGWSIPAAQRSRSYTHLPAGDYVFMVKAFNNNGVEGKTVARFAFTIHPPFWQTWWFRLLALALAAWCMYWLVQLRINSIRKKELEKTAAHQAMAQLENKLLRSQMNPHFIFNSLNSVQKYIWESREEDAAEYLSSFARLMRSILENSRHESIALKDEVDFLKLYIELECRRSNNNFDYQLKIDETIDTSNTLIPPMLLQPFIENAIWHGLNKKRDKGHLLVHIYKKGNELICVVDDDGVGRPPAATAAASAKSLGISITQQRIERLMENTSKQAWVEVQDKTTDGRPCGTKVTVILPWQTNEGHA